MRAAVLSFFLLLPALLHAEVGPLWSFFPGFPLPGVNGMVMQDLDGDGLQEAVITGSPTGFSYPGPDMHLAVLAHGQAGYRLVSLLPLVDTTLSGLIVAVPTAPGAEASVLISQVAPGGTTALVQYAGIPLREIHRIPAPVNFQAQQVADVDADGDLEVLGTAGNWPSTATGVPSIIDLATGAIEWTDTATVFAMAAGQLDADPALEIVIGRESGPGRVLDGATRAEQWVYSPGFNGWPVFGNFHGDNGPVKEFAIVGRWDTTRIFVAEPAFALVDQIPSLQRDSFTVADINGDGYDELIIGEAAWNAITGYSPGLGTVLFQHHNVAHGVSAVAVGDMDGNPGFELIHGGGLTGGGGDIVRVLDAASGAVHYDWVDDRGPHSSILLADLDGNTTEELIWATNGNRSGSTLVVMDAATGVELRRRTDVLEPAGDNPGVSMATLDLDNDGLLEIAVGSGRHYNPELAVCSTGPRWKTAGASRSATQANTLRRSRRFTSTPIRWMTSSWPVASGS